MKNKETRTYTGSIEFRAEGEESRKIIGHAAVFDELSNNLGWFEEWYEKIDRNAFDDVLNDDVRALFNHDPNYPLARTKSGTLSISVDDKGLRYEFDAPNTTIGNDLLEMVKRGDISQSSFAFTIDTQEWVEREGEPTLRIIKKVKRLYDVSPVTYPAYEGTDVAKNSLAEFRAAQTETKPDPEPQKDTNTETEEKLLTLREREIINN